MLRQNYLLEYLPEDLELARGFVPLQAGREGGREEGRKGGREGGEVNVLLDVNCV
jgi:hypothetical protein